jgi:hypothetical protein
VPGPRPSGVRMSDHGNSVPPCWAADPSGRHRFRWWDGTTWTGHVFDGESPPAGAPGPPPTESRPLEHEDWWSSGSERTSDPLERHDDLPPVVTEEPERHERHRPDQARRAFLMGALVGGIVVAVVAIIAWVAFGDSSDTTVATPTTTTTSRKATTTTVAPSSTVASTTTLAARPPAQVRVEVLNGSGVAGAAGSKSTALKNAGYMIAGVGDATRRQGTVVTCKPGFENEAAALAQAVGPGTTTEPFPTPAPTGSENADCVVILGT